MEESKSYNSAQAELEAIKQLATDMVAMCEPLGDLYKRELEAPSYKLRDCINECGGVHIEKMKAWAVKYANIVEEFGRHFGIYNLDWNERLEFTKVKK